jgi:leader peptidase (prepilin peptidase) / N-methyltransferase
MQDRIDAQVTRVALGHASPRGLLVAVAASALIIATQDAIDLVRGGHRRTRTPFGPGLAAGFLLAATSDLGSAVRQAAA